jgi:hypothetical protein
MAKGMGFAAAAASAAKGSGESLANGAKMVAAGARKASSAAKKANPNLLKVAGAGKKKKKKSKFKNMAKKMSSVPMGGGVSNSSDPSAGGY